MTFLEKIKPYLIHNDLLIQDTVLHALHDYPNVPEDWTYELLKEAFKNKEKQSSIFIYIENQTFNEEAVRLLVKNIPTMDKSNLHLALRLCEHIEPELALEYKEQLEKYIRTEIWSLYDLLVHGAEEDVYSEYGTVLNVLENADSYQHDAYTKAKKLAACIVKKGWITENEIDIVVQEQLKEEWFSFNGILNVYMIGLMKLEKYIPVLAELLVSDDDILLEEVADVLIRFQSDEVVKEVAPYLMKQESNIFASSIIENIKTDLAVQVLINAYHAATELEDQDLLIEALCHQLSEEALPEISEHAKKDYVSGMVDIEQVLYGYYSILGLNHPEMQAWRIAALEGDQGNLISNTPVHIENKAGRNDPCPCGSGKKYKKCCGK